MNNADLPFCRAAREAIDNAVNGHSTKFSIGLDLAAAARGIYAARLHRRKFLPAEILGEPCWDILLDLYVAHCERKLVDVTSACIASGVPTTTALRWVKILEDQFLIQRDHDRRDGRRSYLSLSAVGIDVMEGYLRSQAAT